VKLAQATLLLTYALVALAAPAPAHARENTRPGDPFAYNLRIALSPLAFQAAISQSFFGSAARIEYAPVHAFDLALDGRIAWFNANRTDWLARSYALRGVLSFHLSQSVTEQKLYGTVYAAEPAAITASGVGTDQDLNVPVNERMRTSTGPIDRDKTLTSAMRETHSLRVGVSYAKVLERALPVSGFFAQNKVPMLQVGYAFATYWNIPQNVTGKPEVGYRRYYGDLLLTTADLTKSEPDRAFDAKTSQPVALEFQPVGARIGIQGAMEALFTAAPSLGLAYDLELGAYPGRGGIEGYLFLALGVALDIAAH
jgi:hypothetical protein